MVKSLLTEYGLGWTINRSLYALKLKMLNALPITERLFEKRVDVKRVDIFDFDVEEIKLHLLNLSKEKQNEIVSTADKAADGIIKGFSSIELNYGYPINWHYNPLTKRESIRHVKWYRIPDFDPERGDIKVIWEASRLTHFYYFLRAYLITGNKKYYHAFSEQLDHWLADNPYPYGANYKCGQECTLRMINALVAYTVFNYFGLTTDKDLRNVFKLVEVCYRKVLSNFFYAHKCIRNNHTFSEIVGLIIGAWCCHDEKRLYRAYELLEQEIQQQFLPDGGYTQHSFNYQRFALQLMECVFKLVEKTGIQLTKKATSRLKNSVLLMYQLQDESGDVPNYGSNDGALIFPVTACGYQDFRPVLNTIYALLEGKRLYQPGDYDEELLWFGNEELAKAPIIDIERESLACPESGFYSLRHTGGFLMTVLQNFNTRPGQMDQLHIDLWHDGRNIFCDSGTYSYASEIGKQLASTSAHNTVKIEGVEQMDKYGAFLIYNWTKRKNVHFDGTKFTGTMVSKNGYEHTRTITKTSQGYLIDDRITGAGDCCEFAFHTPYQVRVVSIGFEVLEGDVVLSTVEVEGGEIEVRPAFRSLYYLQKEEINCVIVKAKMRNGKCSVKFHIRLTHH